MTFYSISAFLNFLTCTILTFFVAERKPLSPTNRAFAFFSGTSALWSLGYFFWQIANTDNAAIFYARFLMAAAVFIPVTYLHFVIRFTGQYEKKANFLKLSYGVFLFFFIVNFSPLFVSDMHPTQGFKYWPVPGPFFHPFLILWFASIIYAGYLLYQKYKVSTGIIHSQIRYIFFGMILGFMGGSTNYFLWYGIPILPIGSILVSVYVGLLGYAIIKYRLMDIRVFGRKVFIYLVVGLFVYGGFFALAWIHGFLFDGLFTKSSYLAGFVSIPIAVFLFLKMEMFLERVINTYLFPNISNFQKAIANFSMQLARAINIKHITDSIFEMLTSVMGAEKIMLLTVGEDGKSTIEGVVGFDGKILTDNDDIIKYLFYNQAIFVREEFVMEDAAKISDDTKKMIAHLLAADISVCVPLMSSKKLVGVVFLGPKQSGDAYNKEDLSELATFSFQAAVAIENAKLYQKINEFNVTLRKTVAEQTADLKKANAHLLVLDKQKSEFVSIASHQLRSPVTAIKGYSSMLLEGTYGKMPKKVVEIVDKIFQSSQHLVEIVEDFLNITRIEQGRMAYEFSNVDIKEMLTALVEGYSFRADQKAQKINFVADGSGYMVLADAGKIRQVLSNLIDNAIKYSKNKGMIDVRLFKNNETKKIIVSVKDDGIGMSKDTLDKLFKKFSRAEGVEKVYTEGVGLGLYVASEMMKAHEGKIWAHSEGEGKGSIFFVEMNAVE